MMRKKGRRRESTGRRITKRVLGKAWKSFTLLLPTTASIVKRWEIGRHWIMHFCDDFQLSRPFRSTGSRQSPVTERTIGNVLSSAFIGVKGIGAYCYRGVHLLDSSRALHVSFPSWHVFGTAYYITCIGRFIFFLKVVERSWKAIQCIAIRFRHVYEINTVIYICLSHYHITCIPWFLFHPIFYRHLITDCMA